MSAQRSIADLSADLADRAESFCRQYFPEGRKQGNYWQVGDTSGAKGQSLAIRLQAQGGRKAGSWTDYATGQYGDLIDLLHERLGSVTLKETLREVRSFLGEAPCPTAPDTTRSAGRPDTASDKRIARARKLFAAGKPVLGTLAAIYLQGRGISRFGPAPWLPRTGSRVSHRGLTSAVVDSRAYLSAKRRKETEVHCPEGTRIAFSGGDYQAYDLIWSVLDATHAKYPDMVLLHGGTPKGAEMIAARWADIRGVTQVVFKPDWKRFSRCQVYSRPFEVRSITAVGPDSEPASSSCLGLPQMSFCSSRQSLLLAASDISKCHRCSSAKWERVS